MAFRTAGWAGRTFKRNPLRGSPAWLTPVLLIGGAILAIKLISDAKKTTETVAPKAPAPAPTKPQEQTITIAGRQIPVQIPMQLIKTGEEVLTRLI